MLGRMMMALTAVLVATGLGAGRGGAGTGSADATMAQTRPVPPPPIPVNLAVDHFALVERAPVANGFGLFTIEATNLLPAPRKRENFTPPEDEVTYPLRRTVDRFLMRKEVARGWSRSNEARFPFSNELSHFPGKDGVAYAVEGELALHGSRPIPVGVSLSAPPGEVVVRYAMGVMAANQTVMVKEGVLEADNRQVAWMLTLYPNGPDAAIPVRAVFAVRAEGGEEADRRAALEGVSAALNASSDGRAAVAERTNDASEWLKPMQVFIHPDQVAAKSDKDKDKDKEKDKDKDKKEKKEKKGGH